ncbi:hypothetical protein IDSA_11065 [Pseudidiomarina salinarum]|uniref:Regulatory protein RecX n=1 Tax=Pseudidiomarina salinarum TaxID=435908 RepID=A0A094JCK1_9GAMM|nr:regulatory protein RecX [Pseudidiomarina salinarum]KFZ30286.1 hypothetical protein IDSA_11065 [Pseudidiomarina salinarum]RUO69987.1 regulatory protein RecX [Pseudidiomarina salinarum]
MSDNDEQVQANEVMLRLLGRREHSVRELEQKLSQRGFAASIIRVVINEAIARGWQSDERYAELWTRHCLQRGDGINKIKASANAKGISSELLEQALAAEEPDWAELCFERLCKKFGSEPPATPKDRDRRIRHLLQRGFTYPDIKQALERQSDAVAD